jgi:hypothetical protein
LDAFGASKEKKNMFRRESGERSNLRTKQSVSVISMALVPYWTVSMPWYYPLPLLLIFPLGWIVQRLRNRKPPSGFCKNCGYDLRATPGRCPKCGTSAGFVLPATPPTDEDKGT